MAHYDLTSNNIGVDKDSRLKLFDLSRSKWRTRDDETDPTLKGAFTGISPEVLDCMAGRGSSKICPWQYDTFCVGVVMWEMLTVKQPWLFHFCKDHHNSTSRTGTSEDNLADLGDGKAEEDKIGNDDDEEYLPERFPISKSHPRKFET